MTQLFKSFKSSSSVPPATPAKTNESSSISSTIDHTHSIQTDTILVDSQGTDTCNNSALFFYEFQAKHFSAEQVSMS